MRIVVLADVRGAGPGQPTGEFTSETTDASRHQPVGS